MGGPCAELAHHCRTVFAWTAPLTSQRLKAKSRKSRTALPSLYVPPRHTPPHADRTLSRHYELVATLQAYAICLSNNAATLLGALGSYETSRSVSSTALTQMDQRVNDAADKLCQAAGIARFVSDKAIPAWEAQSAPEQIRRRPAEMTRECASALEGMFHADANLLAIRRLLSKSRSIADVTIAPGPPLPSSHPSPSLLAKLHIQVFALYDRASSSSTSTGGCTGELDASLRAYLGSGRTLALALAHKWLGIDAGENGGQSRAGDAVRWLMMAHDELESLSSRRGSRASDTDGGAKAKALKALTRGAKASTTTTGARKDKLTYERESIKAFLDSYRKVNDSVAFQPVPPASELQGQFPGGRAAMNVKVFTPPEPAIKPSARSPSTRLPPPLPDHKLSLGGLDLNDDDGLESSDDEADAWGRDEDEDDAVDAPGSFGASTRGGGGGSYLGAGSYF